MALHAKQLLKKLIDEHPDWNWDNLEGEGFMEIMKAFRFAPEGDQQSVVLAYNLIAEYINRLLTLEEDIKPKKLSYENKLFNSGYNAGLIESQLRAKRKKTDIEKNYIKLADKFNVDLQTILLISKDINGWGKTKEQIIEWTKKQYAQNKNNSYADYYRWLSTFLNKLSTEDFALFKHKTIKPKVKKEITKIPIEKKSIKA